ncbi:SEFIR domain-containing protein [Amycolatopsis sp. NPDC004169]|uniref:SEFIR domain-containing protein n=1 Tax=Amycolatopsis sp. NPDC004169 TaxID=3154453 RepID=UPI0033A5E1B6
MDAPDEPPARRPRVFLSYADDSGAHTEAVLGFAEQLRGELGIDVRLDLWERDQRRDWLAWAMRQIEHGDFVLAIGSPRYKQLATADDEDPDYARFQLLMLREYLAADRARWTAKILPVVLPGYSADDLPAFLQPYSATRYAIPEDLDELVRVLTGQPRWGRPALGPLAKQEGLFDPAVLSADLSRVLVEAATSLAGAVTALWRAEVLRLGLDDPRPLGTRWRVDGGEIDRIGPVFRRDRRLLVLGRPGSGKSVSAIRLVSELLDGWSRGKPVPVLVPVTDWHPGELHPFDWLARRLARDHRLGRTVRWVNGERITLAAALLEVGLVLPVLDGLETIAHDLRPEAVAALNRLGSSVPLVVTCGLAEYGELDAAGVRLARATRAELLPLERDDVEDYLAETVPGGAARLAPLFARLRADPVPTPLLVWLVRVVHQDPGRDPAELGNRDRFPDWDSVEAHLVQHLVQAVYPDYPGHRSPAPRVHHSAARRWLGHLASTGTADIAWWQLDRPLRWVAPACRGAAGAALGFGMLSAFGVVPGLAAAAAVGSAAVNRRLLAYFNATDHVEAPHAFDRSTPKLRAEVRDFVQLMAKWLSFAVGGLALLLAGRAVAAGLVHSVRAALTLTALALGGGFLTWWSGRKLWHRLRHGRSDGLVVLADLRRPSSPAGTLRADRKVAVTGTGIMVAIAAVFAVLGPGYAVRVVLGYAAAWMLLSAYARYTVARLVLAARGRLPWRLFRFLDDARDRGVLRQYGAVHQFRHQHLQRHLGGPA